ncbi:MAG: hypothetical protein ACOX8L_03970 [Candidatus Methanomethylophilaceae archaeon]|jgi:predicted Zn-ribbon and HTH transcriptional regulator
MKLFTGSVRAVSETLSPPENKPSGAEDPSDFGRHRCVCLICGHSWIPRRGKKPKSCPKCRTRKWDSPPTEKHCVRCGHVWMSTVPSPKRCVACSSYLWNEKFDVNKCKKCGHEWVSKRNKMPKRCPSCRSTVWFISRGIFGREDRPKESKEDREGKILSLYREGKSCTQISISESIPYSTVYDTLMRLMADKKSIRV